MRSTHGIVQGGVGENLRRTHQPANSARRAQQTDRFACSVRWLVRPPRPEVEVVVSGDSDASLGHDDRAHWNIDETAT